MTTDDQPDNADTTTVQRGVTKSAASRWRMLCWLMVAGVAIVAVCWLYITSGGDVATAWDALREKVDTLARAHPGYMFLAVAILPLIGFPVSALYVLTGIIYGIVLGTMLAWAGVLVNLIISYLLAAWLLRTPLQSVLARAGYSLPIIRPAALTQTILIIRLTPALPFFVQNYLLGLARIPFGRYLILSAALQFPIAALAIATGGALFEGRLGVAFVAASFLVAAALGFAMLRRYLKERKAPPID